MRVFVLARSSCLGRFCKPSQFTYDWLKLKGSNNKGLDGADRFLSESGSRVDHLFWEQVHAGSSPVFPTNAGGKLPVTTKRLVNFFHYYKRGEGPLLITGGVV